jgi:hypothetical protein
MVREGSMKRQGFVSNSSSSSFLIPKYYLSQAQIDKILDHRNSGLDWADTDYWSIQERDDCIAGDTWMDNFDMGEFLQSINVPMNKVKWSD